MSGPNLNQIRTRVLKHNEGEKREIGQQWLWWSAASPATREKETDIERHRNREIERHREGDGRLGVRCSGRQ